MREMVVLRPGEATEAVRRLMPRAGHTWRRCVAVLDGLSRGRILTDDASDPTWAAVQEFSEDNVLYLGGTLRREQVAALIDTLRRDRSVSVGLRGEDVLVGLLPAGAEVERIDLDFEDRDPAIDLAPLVAPPAGLRLERIDAGLLGRCIWFPWMVREDAALDLGLGYCLLDGERVVAEAFAGPAVGGVLEMAVIHRRGVPPTRAGAGGVRADGPRVRAKRRGDLVEHVAGQRRLGGAGARAGLPQRAALPRPRLAAGWSGVDADEDVGRVEAVGRVLVLRAGGDDGERVDVRLEQDVVVAP